MNILNEIAEKTRERIEKDKKEMPREDLDLKEGDIVRNISVNIRFYEGWDE